MLSFVDGERLTFSAVSSDGQKIDGITKYAWYIGTSGTPISEESTLIVSADSKKYFDMEKVPVDGAYQQTLTLVVTCNGKQYSGSVDFYYIEEVVDYDVTQLEAKTLETVPKTGTRFSTLTSDGQERIIQLVTDTSSSILKDVVISIKMTDGSSGDHSEIAEYNPENGTLELKGGTGDITITATPKYGNGAPKVLDLSIYQATVTSAEQLLNAVNGTLRELLDIFDGDFWQGPVGDAKTYKKEGYTLVTGSGSGYTPSDGYVSFNKKAVTLSGIGNTEFNTESESDIALSVYNPSYWGGHLDTDYIGTINGILKVYLPYNQGIATITYKSVVVQDGKTNRGGSYSVKFDKLLTTEIEDISNTNITDGEGITKVIY